jgi:membrane protein required for colicin V production
MNWLDILIIVFIVASVVGGIMAGIIKILITIAGLIIGVVLAGNYGGALAEKLTFISDANTANIVAFVAIMLVVSLVAALIAFLLKKLFEKILMGWINRVGGAVLGLFLGMILMGAFLAMYVKFVGANATVEGSWMASLLLDKFPVVMGFLPSQFNDIRSFFY